MATFAVALDARVNLRLELVEVSWDINTNTSVVNAQLWLDRTSGTGRWSTNTSPSRSMNIGGQPYGPVNGGYDVRGGSQLQLNANFTIAHNADGTGAVYGSGSFSDPTGNVGSGSVGGTIGLTTIPRATQPTVSPTSGSTASTFTISHVPASSAFTHDIAYSLDGGTTFTDIQTGIPGTDTSTDWTPPHSLIPNAGSATALIRAITKNGGSEIGRRNVSLPLTVPASVKPVVSSVVFADAQTSSPNLPLLMGGVGRFVQRWSRLLPTVTASGAGGSTVVTSKVTLNGQTVDSGAAFGLPITLSGSVPYSAVATDTRGRDSDPYANTVDIKAYNFPNLPVPAVGRTSDAAGLIPSPVGTYLTVTPLASVSALNFGDGEKNLLEWRVRTRPAGGSWTVNQDWTSATVSGNTWTTKYVVGGGFLSSVAYEVEISIRDVFGKNGFDTSNTIKTQTVPVPSELVFMDWSGQDALGLFQYAQTPGLHVGKPIYQEGLPVVDFGDNATTSLPGIVELATDAEAVAGTDATRALTPATATASRASWLGTVSPTWTWGKPDVTLSDGTIVSAFLPANDIDIQPGADVVLERTPGDIWTIVAVKKSAPAFLRQIELAPATGWRTYDAIPGDVQYNASTEAGAAFQGRYSPCYVTKSSAGWVVAAGLFVNATNMVAGTLVTTFPVGMRPAVQMRFNSQQAGGLIVNPDGTVVLGGPVNSQIVSLANIKFNVKATKTTISSAFQNNWVDFGSPYGNARYGVDDYGFGFVEGAMKNGTANTTGIAMWTGLPTTLSHPLVRHQPVATTGLTTAGIYVYSGGLQYMFGGNTEIHLDGTMWDTAAAAIPWQVPTMGSGWTQFNPATYPPSGFYKRPDGLVAMRGFISAGTFGAAPFALPEGYRPKTRLLISTVSNLTLGRVDISPNGNVIPIQGSGWFSLEGILFAADH